MLSDLKNASWCVSASPPCCHIFEPQIWAFLLHGFSVIRNVRNNAFHIYARNTDKKVVGPETRGSSIRVVHLCAYVCVCVCCHQIFDKIFAQQPLWMSRMAAELELDPSWLKQWTGSLSLSPALSLSLLLSVSVSNSLFPTLHFTSFPQCRAQWDQSSFIGLYWVQHRGKATHIIQYRSINRRNSGAEKEERRNIHNYHSW